MRRPSSPSLKWPYATYATTMRQVYIWSHPHYWFPPYFADCSKPTKDWLVMNRLVFVMVVHVHIASSLPVNVTAVPNLSQAKNHCFLISELPSISWTGLFSRIVCWITVWIRSLLNSRRQNEGIKSLPFVFKIQPCKIWQFLPNFDNTQFWRKYVFVAMIHSPEKNVSTLGMGVTLSCCEVIHGQSKLNSVVILIELFLLWCIILARVLLFLTLLFHDLFHYNILFNLHDDHYFWCLVVPDFMH